MFSLDIIFFDFFVNLMNLGTNLDFILDTFGGLGRPVWWFLGVLESHWNFIEFHDLAGSKILRPSQERVKRLIPGGQQLPTTVAGSCKIWILQAESLQAEKV